MFSSKACQICVTITPKLLYLLPNLLQMSDRPGQHLLSSLFARRLSPSSRAPSLSAFLKCFGLGVPWRHLNLATTWVRDGRHCLETPKRLPPAPPCRQAAAGATKLSLRLALGADIDRLHGRAQHGRLACALGRSRSSRQDGGLAAAARGGWRPRCCRTPGGGRCWGRRLLGCAAAGGGRVQSG
jgi:hypothetical protein